MDVRSPLFQNIAAVLAGVMFLNPIVSTAAELTAASGSGVTVGEARNGVPVVNIAAPNGNGLSHNRFTDYNVGQQGLILNNATDRTQATQLGGIILGNPNLNGRAAGMILNEVTGSNASRLQGYTEVAGKSAHVIVANPHGITCDGCGFINTPRATLSTGTPVIEGGRLDRFDVEGGSITIEGQGLNASNVDQFDLITRSARINAELHANALNVITGRNEVKADDLSATAKAPDAGDKPMLAIDSSALGGMYAGAIRLVGTEAGVGVKLAGDMAASAGDIRIDANGKLSLGRTAASNALQIAAQQVELNADTYAGGAARITARDSLANSQSLAAGGSVTLQAQALINEGIVEAGVNPDNSRNASADMTLDAQNIRNSGTLVAGRVLEANARTLDNQGGTLSAATARIDAGTLNNQQGRVLGSQQVSVSAAQLDNRAGLVQSRGNADVGGIDLDNRGGDIIALGDLAITAATLDNREQGRVVAQGQASLVTDSLDNRGGLVSGSKVSAQVTGQVDNRDEGLLVSDGALDLKAGRLDSSNGGEVSARGDLTADLGEMAQVGGRLIGEAAVSLQLNGGALDNRGGLIHGKGPVSLDAVGTFDNRGGEVSTISALNVTAGRIDNSQGGRLIASGTLKSDAGQLDNRGGLVSGWQGVTVTGGNLDNSQSGTLSSRDGSLAVDLSGHLDNSAEGALVSKGNQTLRAAGLDNRHNGIISSEGDIVARLDTTLDNSDGGLLSAAGTLAIEAGAIRNAGGQLGGADNVRLRADSLDNRQGRLTAAGTLDLLFGASLLNGGGRLASGRDLLLVASEIDNQGGQIASQGLLDLFATSLASAGGTLGARDSLSLRLADTLDNSADGLIFSQAGAVSVEADSLDNRQGALQGHGAVTVATAGALDNRGGTIISQQGNVDLHASSLDNGDGGVLNSLAGWLSVVTGGLFGNAGGVAQGQAVDIQAGSLDNDQGHLSAIGGDTRIVTGDLLNRGGGLYARDALHLEADAFDNSAGQVGARQIDFSLHGALNNASGLIESASVLNLQAASLTNEGGTLRALGQTGSTRISTTGGALDNRRGLIETANGDLYLSVEGFLNDGGTLRHVGTGTFGLASHLAAQGGGNLITNGLLDIQAANWTHSGLIQANRLNLDVGTFTQTASGQLLATGAFTGTGGTWINDGLIASDGGLSLNLTGDYSGSGQLTSLGDLALTAAALDLASAGRIAGGAITTIDIAGQATNRGRLTSTGDFTLRSATLNNYGTLGGAEQVRLKAGSIRNERGLIFSGGDLQFNTTEFTNFYGDVYSLGRLSIAGLDGLSANLIDNVSATLESVQDIALQAVTIRNRREQFGISRTLVSSSMGVYCHDCSGSTYTVDYIVRDIYEGGFGDESPAGWIVSGNNLKLAGDVVLNEASTISAAGDIEIVAGSFSNVGAISGTIERVRVFHSGPVTDGTVYRFVTGQLIPYNRVYSAEFPGVIYRTRSGEVRLALPETDYECFDGTCWRYTAWRDSVTKQYVDVSVDYGNSIPASQYSREAAATAQLPREFTVYALSGDTEVVSPGGEIRTAVVQAGGNVSITASQTLENSDIRHGYRPSTGSARGGETAVVSAATQTVQLNPQLPPDLQQKAVNPLDLPGFSLPHGENGLFRLNNQSGEAANGGAMTDPLPGEQQLAQVQGVPGTTRPATIGHKYLIETNPALTDLKQFMSSDYLLGLLGYDTDVAQKRLGDGLYEQRLIREAIVARTGQRYLAGLTSDEAMFRYLMDNAIASKDALGLALGVSLTAEQVAALTHDIVWMEEHEVMGETVLVPVLYLAQAEGRLAPNGALIQGRDVALISGGELTNQGTLRASQNLDISAENIANSGLMRANDRLQLLATESIRNAAGGIIAGRDVIAVALTGDIVNERTVSTHLVQNSNHYGYRQDFIDSAASIEAGNSLSLSAGQDLLNIGGKLSAGGNASINAGRDLVVASQSEEDSYSIRERKSRSSEQSITQHGSDIQVGGDLLMQAERDMAIIGSKVQAGGDVVLQANENLIIASAADEYHADSYRKSGGKKVTTERDTVTQIGSEISAGGDFISISGADTTLVASKIEAGNEAYLYAGGHLDVLAAQDSDYSLYDMKKKGSFGSKKTRRDEVTDVRNVGSTITTGGDLTLVSEGDQLYQKARLESGNDLVLDAGGAIVFEGVKDLHQESHEKSSNSLAWTSAKGKGTTDETLQQSVLIAKGETVIKAVDGLQIDIKDVNQQTVSQTIDAMVKADPELAWLKEMEQRGDVDWQRVKEVHDSFKYSHSGLGAGAQMVLAIAMAVAMGPAGLALGGATTSAVAATFSTAAINSAISNKGNLGSVLKDVSSSDAMKSYVFSAATAGIGAQFGYQPTALGLNWANVSQVATKTVVDATLKTAIYGGSYKDNLASAALSNAANIVSAAAFKYVGDYASEQLKVAVTSGDAAAIDLWKEGGLGRTAMHATMGGLLSSSMGQGFASGALAAGANQALSGLLSESIAQNDEIREAIAQSVGVVAAGLTGKDLDKGAMIAAQADKYNRQLHSDEAAFLQELALGDPERAGAWDAAACALVRCSQGVPVSDQRYAQLAALEAEGALYPEFQAALKQTGLFNYSSSEKLADAISKNGEELYYAGAWGSVVGGAGGAVFSGLGGVGSCGVTLGLGCAGAVLGVAGGVDQFNDGLARAFADYQSTEGQRVLASFRPDSHIGDTSLWYGLGDFALTQAADIALSKLGGNLVTKIDGKLGIGPKDVIISRGKYGEAADHISDAQKAGHPDVLTIDRPGAPDNRKESIGGLQKVPGKQLDEYPPAMFKEGGLGASVRPISPRDNMAAGACIGNACRGLSEGDKVRIKVVD
ncbi:heme utilization protein [Stutzerimonas nosocomialis]|uniref:two-partner secretion domain-containing protein n=1 Tax=Stutzerimonas nosocomialis TaxID=1056496 RepID=UPI001109D465|nr:DUF637 domain-containing protein [Stutzerimonas nosocomialis]TLX58759.1 heme utilization protein [Stutzerimonas nosocomialis]